MPRKPALASLICLLLPALSHAESTTTASAVATSTATSRVDFSITVPAVLFLRIGTGSGVGAANNATVDGLTFTVPATNIGDGTVVAGSAASGDLTNGAVTVRVFSNVGSNVTLNSSVTGQLKTTAGDTINWSQIGVTAAALTTGTAGYTNGAITHPAFSATTGAGTATTLTAASKLVRQEGRWTFTYLNANTVPAGTYGSTAANNGRVTYTATQL